MHQLTLAEIARGLAEKKFSSEELTKTLLARIARLDPQINSFITLTEDLALEQAKAAGKLAKDFVLDQRFCDNTPERLEALRERHPRLFPKRV